MVKRGTIDLRYSSTRTWMVSETAISSNFQSFFHPNGTDIVTIVHTLHMLRYSKAFERASGVNHVS